MEKKGVTREISPHYMDAIPIPSSTAYIPILEMNPQLTSVF